MNGFVITHLGKRCKIGSDDSFATIICSLVIQRNEFILEGGNMSGYFNALFRKTGIHLNRM